MSELQKRANQLVLFFWPVLIFAKSTRKTGKNTQKQAKTREKQALFWCSFFGGKNWSVLIFRPFATMYDT